MLMERSQNDENRRIKPKPDIARAPALPRPRGARLRAIPARTRLSAAADSHRLEE